jgi:hypothetical protein
VISGRDDGVEDRRPSRSRRAAKVGSRSLAGTITEVGYEVVGDLAITEGDIVLGTVEEVVARDLELRRPGIRSGTRAGGSDFNWPGLVVPFEISSALSDTLKTRIQSAIDHWNANTVFRLRARDGEADFVRFVSGSGCSSPVGRQAATEHQPVRQVWRGSIIHGSAAIRLFHEQTRTTATTSSSYGRQRDEGKEHNQQVRSRGRERRPARLQFDHALRLLRVLLERRADDDQLDGTTFGA